MQVKQTLSKDLKRSFDITIPNETIEARINTKLQGIGKQAKIKGFREGKAPLDLVKKKYGAQVRGEVLEQLVQETSQQALTQQNIKPATQPKIDIVSFEDGKDLHYSMELEILPDVPAVDYKAITVEKLKVTIEDNDIDEALGRLAEQTKQWVKEADDVRAKDGHAVKIDFKGFLGDEAFEGGTGNGMQVVLGAGQMIPGFEEQLTGVKAGDSKTLNVTFPKAYHSKDLAGKDARFEVKVHEVLKGEAATLNNEFAQQIGFKNMADLREYMHKQVQKDIDSLVRNRVKQALFDILEEKYAFSVPEKMLEIEYQSIEEQVAREKEQGVTDPELEGKSDAEIKKEFMRVAKRRVELGIMFSSISEREDVKLTNQEIVEEISRQAAQFPGQESAVREYFQKNPRAIQQLAGPLLEEKVVDYILGKVTVKDKPMLLKELRAENDAKAASVSSKPKKKK